MGCSTVQRVVGGVVTVIARVLPESRRRGLGAALYEHALGYARGQGDGLRFAARCGFAEVERYVLDGERDEWVDLRLAL